MHVGKLHEQIFRVLDLARGRQLEHHGRRFETLFLGHIDPAVLRILVIGGIERERNAKRVTAEHDQAQRFAPFVNALLFAAVCDFYAAVQRQFVEERNVAFLDLFFRTVELRLEGIRITDEVALFVVFAADEGEFLPHRGRHVGRFHDAHSAVELVCAFGGRHRFRKAFFVVRGDDAHFQILVVFVVLVHILFGEVVLFFFFVGNPKRAAVFHTLEHA